MVSSIQFHIPSLPDVIHNPLQFQSIHDSNLYGDWRWTMNQHIESTDFRINKFPFVCLCVCVLQCWRFDDESSDDIVLVQRWQITEKQYIKISRWMRNENGWILSDFYMSHTMAVPDFNSAGASKSINDDDFSFANEYGCAVHVVHCTMYTTMWAICVTT